MTLITCKNLTLGYEYQKVLNDLSFQVETGDYLCILGDNGSGKSTLMKAILGLIKPISGTIIYGDGLSPKQIGYLPQQTHIQRDFPASVLEIVMSGRGGRLGFSPFYSKKDREIVDNAMKSLEISNLSKKCYRNLSGGQQQRVLLARALCATEKLFLLDEPVTGLDPKATEDLYETIMKLNKQGITIIMISHDVPAALKYSNKILRIGENPYFGETRKFKLRNISCSAISGMEGI